MTLTAIEVELLRNGLTSICDEMYVALMKSAYSTNIKERKDHSAAIIDAQGRVIVQGESLPLHLASMLGLVEVVLERVGIENLRPGDMFISNDPFVGRGSHLPDVALVAPVYYGDDLVFFVADIAHHADIGGMAPGSMAGGMTEVYQEGLRIPPIRLMKDGEIIEDVFDLILLNVRVPEERRGDYLAQVAANRLGERRLHELFQRWSLEQLREGADALVHAVARRMRAGIADLPDGEYTFSDIMDDDGMGTENIPFCIRIVVDGEEILFDFTGSSPQVRGNINISFAGLQASVLFALKVLIDPDGPTNHGMLEPVRIVAEEGSITNAAFPAATAARAQACQRVIDIVLGALSKAVPERVIAASNGANGVSAFFGAGPDGRYYVYMETIGGGSGARSYKDGKDGVQVHVTNTSNLPVEALENEYPLLIERYELVPNSGGPGTWRGGCGLHRVYRPLGHTTVFSGQGERCVHHPWGLFGGGEGGLGSFSLDFDDGRSQALPIKPTTVEIPPDAAVTVITPGAGGYGSPAGRGQVDLADDLANGLFSKEYMKEHYGFEIEDEKPAVTDEETKT
ncbi:MAG: hydantoinase B/oxoprolinase family protein [Rhodospirillales bacterium]|jgi:N-methylhydantoinase B|nr:hydantoinase B/oxoprolinase family protein [Rhodospirillales bacterium]